MNTTVGQLGRSASRIRLGAVALGLAGLLFLAFPVSRPWDDQGPTLTLTGATAAFSSGAWVLSHFFGMLAFILTGLGLLALHELLSRSGSELAAFWAVVTGWLGIGLTLPFFGAEAFGLNAVARLAVEGRQVELLAATEAIRYGALAVATFAGGLLLVAVSGILAGVAVWRSGSLPRYGSVLFAAGLALYIPQFFLPPALRIAHGVLLALGTLWLAASIGNAGRRAAGQG